jgi:hypothetical protein
MTPVKIWRCTVDFSELPRSTDWAALRYRGERIADVWLKPDGDPLTLIIRVPRTSFQSPDVGPLLTAANLLKSVGLAIEEIESWAYAGASHAGMNGSNPELGEPLSAPETGGDLEIRVRMKPSTQDDSPDASSEVDLPPAKWQELEARWNAILRFEGSIASLRSSMEGVRAEMEAATTKALTAEEKLHAVNADVVQWNQAKSRVLFTVPKARDYIHRSIWGVDTPERKELEEFFKVQVRSISPDRLETIQRQVEGLLKHRQVLSAEGATVYNECQRMVSEVQGTLRTLQGNAAANAVKKRAAARAKGKFF